MTVSGVTDSITSYSYATPPVQPQQNKSLPQPYSSDSVSISSEAQTLLSDNIKKDKEIKEVRIDRARESRRAENTKEANIAKRAQQAFSTTA